MPLTINGAGENGNAGMAKHKGGAPKANRNVEAAKKRREEARLKEKDAECEEIAISWQQQSAKQLEGRAQVWQQQIAKSWMEKQFRQAEQRRRP